MDKIKIFNSKADLFSELTQLIQSELDSNDRINISLSGGSTPKSLFQFWSEKHQSDIRWDSICFFWGDERCVPPDDEQSNYGMTRKFLFDPLQISSENIYRIEGENDPDEEALRYANILDDLLPQKDGLPRFDIMILGLGDDGHTASIFPHQIELWDSTEHCVVATHPYTGQKRVSLSGRMINNSGIVVFLVTGGNKKDVVEKILNSRQEVKNLFPAALVSPSSKKLTWYLDSEAAGNLK